MAGRRCPVWLWVLLLAGLTAAGAPGDGGALVPDWLRSGEPVRVEQVSEKDYPYLAQWVGEHAKPAQDYILQLFATHQVVIFAEEHNVKEHKTFVRELIPRLYHEAGVRCIGWEFSPHANDQRLAELIDAPTCNEEAIWQFARDCSADWNSRDHWEIIKAIWSLNKSLKPGQEKMRLVGLGADVDIVNMYIVARTKPPDSPEFQKVLDESISADKSMARHAEEEILEKRHKGFLFVGLGHDWTEYHYPPEAAFGRSYQPMGSLLKEKYGDRIFQVRALCSADPAVIQQVMKLRNHEWVGFTMQDSPFANLLVPVGKGAPDVPWSRLACGYVYLGPRANFHRNTPIAGFVTEAMFQKYRQYYEVCWDHRFNTAAEVDEYLQQHRWPQPH
jgi:hypothetical protein